MSFWTKIKEFFTGNTYRPLPNILWQIYLEPYSFPGNCCSHKAAKYAQALNDANIRANVIVGSVSSGPPHAWVHVVHPETGCVHMVDPTWTDHGGMVVEEYPRRVPSYKFREGVTGHEVFTYQGVIEEHGKP